MGKVKLTKKILYGVVGLLLTPILFFVILAVLLYLPPVQNWAVQKVAAYASETIGMEVSVGRVNLAFPLDLRISNFKAIQRRDSLPQVRDTIADVASLIVDVKLKPLFDNKVVVNELEANDLKLNTASFISSARVKGRVGQLYATSRGIDLTQETVDVSGALLANANLLVELSDTTKEDTTQSEAKWRIAIARAAIEKTNLELHLPGDTMRIGVYAGKLVAKRGDIDLGTARYEVGSLEWADGRLTYDNRFEPKVKGLDVNHIALADIQLAVDSIYYCAPEAKAVVRHFSLEEKSGLKLEDLQTSLRLDSTTAYIPVFRLCTPDSKIEADADVDLNVMDDLHPGKARLNITASIGKADIFRFVGGLPKAFTTAWPNHPLTAEARVEGNMKAAKIEKCKLELPTAFTLTAEGTAKKLTDMERLEADVKLKGKTQNLNFLTSLMGSAAKDYRIPSGMTLDAKAKVRGADYTGDLLATIVKGKVKADGHFNSKSESYAANVDIQKLNLHDFLPHDSLYQLSATLSAEGQGFDPYSSKTKARLEAKVSQFRYGSWQLGGMKASALWRNRVGHADVSSHNPMVDGTIRADAAVQGKVIQATMSTDLKEADLHALRLMANPFTLALNSQLVAATDLTHYYKLQGIVNDFTVNANGQTFHPKDLTLDIHTDLDTTWAEVASGSLELSFHASDGYEALMKKGMLIGDSLASHIENKVIDMAVLRRFLPTADLHIVSAADNPLANYLRFKGFLFDEARIDLVSSPVDGINGGGHIYSLVADSTQIDTIRFQMAQDSTQVNFNAYVKNGPKNPQFVFTALVDGQVVGNGAGMNVKLLDKDDQLGLRLGLAAEMLDSGIVAHLKPYNAVLGYKDFDINKDNYIYFGRDQRVYAKVDLAADDGTGVKIYSDNDNHEALQDMTVSLSKFDLGKITSVLPFAPYIEGQLGGDFHAIQDLEGKFSVLSDLSVDGLAYEHSKIGDVGSEFVYMQREDGSHAVDGNLSLGGHEIGTIKGSYLNEGEGYLDATATFDHMILNIANGLIPDQLFGLDGYADGELAVKGPLSAPVINGELYIDSGYVFSTPYGVHLRMDNDPVTIKDSRLLLENFSLYANNDNPLTISGQIDFSNLDRILLNMRMRAKDYLLVDAKKSSRAIAYGKAYVDFMGNLNGDLDNLKMRGNLTVLGKTDVTYVLRDSPLSTDDQLKGLVTFKDFRDTTTVADVAKPPVDGLDMQLMMNVETGTRVFCALNADQSNYVELEGGGELRMLYNSVDELQLFGRYTVNSGEMKYALPIIPLKTFDLQQGSYVEFTGDIMNPTLNLTATEQTKAPVTSDGGASRSVLFECGVKVTKTLQDMGLEFTLDAPEDMTVKNDLAAMSAEQRGRMAVTMLTTGIYMSDNSSGLTMNSALNSFLQSEINNITASAMRTTDLSLGLDQGTSASGDTYTDYSFKFSKRLWNNRFNFVIGGKYSTGSATTASQDDQMFIDNVSLEYRLDESAQRYVRAFYNKAAEDLLEGSISKYGAGLVWRKKMSSLTDLFRFGNKQQGIMPVEGDTTRYGRKDTPNTDEKK